ncbi:flagellar basal body M-ring protein FliF [Oxalobacteraceae bacterium CAVE-383]|nr:flagellar basal body M-ring protein FliF [Oxalobacteraceae bacterium CAVE-383]
MAVADGVLDETSPETAAAAETPAPPSSPVTGFVRSKQGQRILMMVGAAAVIALMIGIWMWSQKVEYRVLFSNFSDRDGGAIVASLQQMNVPYKFSDTGNAILVPENVVHDARLKLAAQGLPKGGNVGFELMENQKLGISQFLEQVNFQRALEGELARSIESLDSVAGARVHLALPKASVFVRDQQKPTASVILNLRAGRVLDNEQVSAIVHLVASSVPDLPPKNVTIIDQNGNLLSSDAKKPANSGLDPSQMKYIQDVQQDIVKRVESIITPIVGSGNVRAEATADIDFSRTEQAAEVYKPNQAPNSAAIRSQQSAETSNPNAAAGGIPGALTNQPPAPATAPIVQPVPGGPGAAPAASSTVQKDSTTNYEVDKTVSYVQQPMVGVKRLTVAVVVNYKRVYNANGVASMKPLTDPEKQQITELVREAMGYNKDRGDSLNVVNTQFSAEPEIELPLWKQPNMISLALLIGKYLLVFIVLMILYFRMLRPIIWNLTGKTERDAKAKAEAEAAAAAAEAAAEEAERMANDPDAYVNLSGEGEPDFIPVMSYKENLEIAKSMAKRDPKLVASVIKGWVNNE